MRNDMMNADYQPLQESSKLNDKSSMNNSSPDAISRSLCPPTTTCLLPNVLTCQQTPVICQRPPDTCQGPPATCQGIPAAACHFGQVPSIVIIDDCEKPLQAPSDRKSVAANTHCRGINHKVSSRKLNAKIDNEQAAINTGHTEPASQFIDNYDQPIKSHFNLKPARESHRKQKPRLEKLQLATREKDRDFTTDKFVEYVEQQVIVEPGRMNHFLHRRSHSHPEQLNLVGTDEDSSHNLSGISNGAAFSPPTIVHPKHNLVQESFHQSNRSFPFTEKETRKFEEECESLEHENDTEEVFVCPIDEGQEEEQSLWNRPSEFKLRDQFYSFFQASDNKLAMKLFGSRNALLKEKQRQMEAKAWIIHPCSNFRLYWDLLMLIFLITNLVVLPVSIAFFYDDIGVHWIVFNITCDTMFILDIVINFRTGLIDQESHGNVILDPRTIALRYLKSWFAVDFVSSLPLDYVFLGLEDQSYSAGRALRILRLAKLLQLLRLLRISRLVRYVRLWKEFFSLASVVVKLFNLICVMVLMGHWSGCIQFFVPVIQGLPSDSWIVLNNLQHAYWWEQYSKALFKALSHMLCIGYGQFPPRNMTDTWLTIASMLAGATCYALFIGHATTLIQSFDTSSRQFRDHLQQVNEYMIYRKLPAELRRRITDYYEHRFGGKLFDEAAILSEISDSLRKDVIQHNCRELIRSVPFFLKADDSFVTDVITKLEFEMFQPSDTIIKEGTKGDRMFFIQEGLIEILTSEGKIVTRLGDGSYFGEISLLTRKTRTATVRAASYCNLFSLSKEHFDRILENYPLMRRTLETIAAKRLHKLGKDPNIVTSRESLLDDINGIQKVFEVNDPGSEDEDSERSLSPTPSKESNSQFLTVVKSFFTKDSEDFSPTSRTPSMKSGLSPPAHSLPRCKSALNATLNHLVMVPQAQVKNKLGRAKSTADVQAVNVGDFQSKPFDPTPDRRASFSPFLKKKTKQNEGSAGEGPAVYWQKGKVCASQPTSPKLSTQPSLSRKKTRSTDASGFAYSKIPPKVKVNVHDDSDSSPTSEEHVRFILNDENILSA